MFKRIFLKSISGILTLIIMLTLISCAEDASGNKNLQLPDGFSVSDKFTGGQNFKNANLYSISAETDEDLYRFTVKFKAGSAQSSVKESNVSKVPEYSASMLESPGRILINFQSVPYADYIYSKDLSACSDIVYDAFSVSDQNGGLSLLLQLKSNAAFKVYDEGNKLVIELFKLNSQPSSDKYYYHVAADLEREYMQGSIKDFLLTPCLTRTNGHVLFISAPCASAKDAEKKLSEISAAYPDFSDKLYTVALYVNDLPEYRISTNDKSAYDANPIEIDKKAMTPDILIENGLYYTTTPEGYALYGAQRKIQDEVYWELYSKNSEDRNPYVKLMFETIESVLYSPDGTRLAVLENAKDGSHLYIFDMNTGDVLYDLSELGFGKRISRFVWNEDGTAIYSVSGTTTVQVNKYDFKIADESARYSVVYPQYTDETGLSILDGFVYFVLTEQADSEIFKIRPDGGAHTLFAKGSAFSFSPDKKSCAVTTASTVSSGVASEFMIIDLESGEKTLINVEFSVFDFVWSYDSHDLYFIENTLSTADGEGEEADEQTPEPNDTEETAYPYVLYRYSKETGDIKEICRMKYGMVYAAPNEHKIYIPYYDIETMGENICATYVIDTAQ